MNIITEAIFLLNEKKWDDILKKYRKNGIFLISSDEFLKKRTCSNENDEIDNGYSIYALCIILDRWISRNYNANIGELL